MKIYLAGRYGRREELLGYAQQLEKLGHRITSRWLRGEHESADWQFNSLPNELKRAVGRGWAEDDLEDIEAAECLAAFTEEPGNGSSRGGRHVELGIALAMRLNPYLHHEGMRVVVVGPRENVFCCLKQIQWFATPAEFLAEMDRDAAKGGAATVVGREGGQ